MTSDKQPRDWPAAVDIALGIAAALAAWALVIAEGHSSRRACLTDGVEIGAGGAVALSQVAVTRR